MRPGAAGLLALIVTTAAPPAYAGGAWMPVRGVRPLSMGGAFVAGAEEANALWYNPSRIDGTSASLDLGGVFLSSTFTAPDGASADNQGRPLPNPTLGIIYRINEMFSVGAGVYAPYSPQLRFDEGGPQRYTLVESDRITKLIVNLAAAVRVGPFRLGAGLQNVDFHLRQRTVLSGYTGLFGQPTSPELDVLNELEMHDPFTLTGNIGVSGDFGPFTVGAAVQLPYTAKGQATFRVRLGSSVFFDPIEVEGDTVDFAVPFPTMVRGGIRWRASEALAVEAAINWEDWSVQDELVIDPKGGIRLLDVPGIGDYEMGPLVVDRRMKDTLSAHLGASYQVLEPLELRGGAYFETSSFDDVTFSVAQIDSTKLGFAGGLAYTWRWLRVDAAVSYVHQLPREITNSELRQINPTNPEQAVVVGNGRHTSHVWMAGLGVTWRLPEPS